LSERRLVNWSIMPWLMSTPTMDLTCGSSCIEMSPTGQENIKTC
jgi:hypothetical protein